MPNKDNLLGNSSQEQTPLNKHLLQNKKENQGVGLHTMSGHLRARNSNGCWKAIFDDEDKSNSSNIKTGVAAEEIVSELIKSALQPDFFDHIGGTNTGFDIHYRLGKEDYFVEVKGLMGSWNDSDVLLSKAQFEKAQEEKERFSIFVVEFVGDEKKELSGKSETRLNTLKKCKLIMGGVNLRFPITKLLQRSAGTFLLMVED